MTLSKAYVSKLWLMHMESGLGEVPERKVGVEEVRKAVRRFLQWSRLDVTSAWTEGMVVEVVERLDEVDVYFRSYTGMTWRTTE